MAGEKILIVEDEAIVGNYLQNRLKAFGYVVSGIASSGEEAIEKTKGDRPDLILMDIVLKGDMDGIEAAERIGLIFDIPLIYLTAYADEKFFQRAKITEPFGYILKPVEERGLQIAIEMALYKHKMAKILKEREQWFSTTLRSIGDAVIATDAMGFVTFVNPVAQKLIGLSEKEILGRILEDVFQALDEITGRPKENPAAEVIREGKIVGLSNAVLVNKKSEKIPIDDSGAPIIDEKGKLLGAVLVFHDATERKRREEELKDLHKQLRALANGLQTGREEERKSVSRQVYDDLGQAMMVLKMDVSWLNKKLPKGERLLRERVRGMKKLIDDTIQKVKRISASLRPGLLDDLGLSAAMEWQGKEFEGRTGIRCRVKIEPEEVVLEEELSTAVFRIFQELLTNVGCHSGATRVEVSLKKGVNRLELRVQDNGKGITANQISDPESLELLEIRERVHPWGGEVKIEGVPKKGTTATVVIPLSTED